MSETHIVLLTADRAFEPAHIRVRPGDTVEWRGLGRGDAILPVDRGRGGQLAPRGFDPDDPDDFTGPLVRLVPGVHVINQPREPVGETLPAWVWEEPGLTTVYIRLNWQIINPKPGVYDWASLDPHMDAAVRSGKHFGTSVRAGVQETPKWLFDQRLGDLRCLPVDFQGIKRTIGAPYDPAYQHWYFEMLRELARHIAKRNAWWQRLVSVRPSGANYHSAEARLPNREIGEKKMRPAREGGNVPAVADRTVWQDLGYTPDGLYGFFETQEELLAQLFPHVDICYPLIQDGFPRANADNPEDLPAGTQQTETIIRRGRATLGDRWVVQHLGVQPVPMEDGRPVPFPCRGWHPIEWMPPRGRGEGRYKWVRSGFPNSWALRAGLDGSPTAWQTINNLPSRGRFSLESALLNAWRHSDGYWLEVYARDVWPSFDAGSGPVGPSGRTLVDWSQMFYEWRMQSRPEPGDPFPSSHRHTFVGGRGARRLRYALNRDPSVAGAVQLLPDGPPGS